LYVRATSFSFYLDELLGETARTAGVLGASKKITVALPPLTESLCYGDEDSLRISNLLDNAVKFTPRCGRVDLNLEQKGGSYLVSISDNGPGIPAEAQARVFERFFRLENVDPRCDSVSSMGAGAGLGSSIARSIAEAHGGSFSLVRSDSNGTSFVAVLPVNPQLSKAESIH
jgi:signal transduction histidine kinase